MNVTARRQPPEEVSQKDATKAIGQHIQMEKLRILQIKREHLQGAVVPREFHEECLELVTDVLIRCFEELPAAVASQVVGLTPAEAEQLITDRINAIRHQVANEALAQRVRTNGETKKRRVGRPLKDDQS